MLYEVLDAHDLPARQVKQRALADFEKGECFTRPGTSQAPSAIWSEFWLVTHRTQLSTFCLNALAASLEGRSMIMNWEKAVIAAIIAFPRA